MLTALIGDLLLYKTETHLNPFWCWYECENILFERPRLKT